ncbi:MAG: hypothetical protein HN948_05260 [Clostridia bacterium]|nr:hypothetical protein [Clostridia bacterium]MBT7122401.1 hypothetical protein [Clostridia bacterium]
MRFFGGIIERIAFVAQPGGPSPVINSSLLGVIEACRDYDGIETIYV